MPEKSPSPYDTATKEELKAERERLEGVMHFG